MGWQDWVLNCELRVLAVFLKTLCGRSLLRRTLLFYILNGPVKFPLVTSYGFLDYNFFDHLVSYCLLLGLCSVRLLLKGNTGETFKVYDLNVEAGASEEDEDEIDWEEG